MAALWLLGWNLNKDPHFPQPRYLCALRARLASLILSGVRHRGQLSNMARLFIRKLHNEIVTIRGSSTLRKKDLE